MCEFVPSGTIPTISAQSPITFAAIDVIGATVVTTWNCDVDSADSVASAESVGAAVSSELDSSLPHAAATTANAAAHAINRRADDREADVCELDDCEVVRTEGNDDMKANSTCDLFASAVVLEIAVEHAFRAARSVLPRR